MFKGELKNLPASYVMIGRLIWQALGNDQNMLMPMCHIPNTAISAIHYIRRLLLWLPYKLNAVRLFLSNCEWICKKYQNNDRKMTNLLDHVMFGTIYDWFLAPHSTFRFFTLLLRRFGHHLFGRIEVNKICEIESFW